MGLWSRSNGHSVFVLNSCVLMDPSWMFRFDNDIINAGFLSFVLVGILFGSLNVVRQLCKYCY